MKHAIAYLLAAALLLSLLCGLAGCGSKNEVGFPGADYIRALETQDPGIVDRTLKQRAEARREAERELLRQEKEKRLAEIEAMFDRLESGEEDVWPLFEDYFILGDSRAAEFSGLTKLDDNRIFGQYGATINTIPDELYRAKEKNPAYLFLIFGLNDIRWWDTPEAFTEVYRKRLEYVREQLPDTVVFVNCIFPCTGKAFEKYDVWRRAPEYNEALREMVAQTDCVFLACDDIYDPGEHFRSDGIHFTAEFYRLWGIRMLRAVYDAEYGD